MNRTIVEHGSEPWKIMRKDTACASEIAALIGIDEDRSRAKCLREKANPGSHKLDPTAERMCTLGKIYEPVALDALQHCLPAPLVDLGSLIYCAQPVFEGRPDGVTVCPRTGAWIPVEVKTRAYPNPLDSVPYETKFDVKRKHWIQLQCYMKILNAPYGILMSFSPNHGWKVYFQQYSDMLWRLHIAPTIESFLTGNLKDRVNSKDKKSCLDLIKYLLENNTWE